MVRDLTPLLVGESARLVEHLEWHARLADVVKQRGHSEIVELELRETEALSERNRENANVHTVGKRVLVIVANRRESEERHFIVQDLIDDRLHDTLDLLDARTLPHPHRRHQVLRDGDGLGVRPLRALLRTLAIFAAFVRGLAQRERGDARREKLVDELVEAFIGRQIAALNEREKPLPIPRRYL